VSQNDRAAITEADAEVRDLEQQLEAKEAEFRLAVLAVVQPSNRRRQARAVRRLLPEHGSATDSARQNYSARRTVLMHHLTSRG